MEKQVELQIELVARESFLVRHPRLLCLLALVVLLIPGRVRPRLLMRVVVENPHGTLLCDRTGWRQRIETLTLVRFGYAAADDESELDFELRAA